MSAIECVADHAASKNRRDCCGLLRDRRSFVESVLPPLLACLICIGTFGDVAHGSSVDAYQQLENYGFPIGLLPHTVTGYDLKENGKFSLNLESKCEIDIPSAFPVVYNKKISGKLAYGTLRDLSGIQVKIYYFWLSISSITVKSNDSLQFDVGIISQTYPIHPNFDENPECVEKCNSEALPYLEAEE